MTYDCWLVSFRRQSQQWHFVRRTGAQLVWTINWNCSEQYQTIHLCLRTIRFNPQGLCHVKNRKRYHVQTMYFSCAKAWQTSYKMYTDFTYVFVNECECERTLSGKEYGEYTLYCNLSETLWKILFQTGNHECVEWVQSSCWLKYCDGFSHALYRVKFMISVTNFAFSWNFVQINRVFPYYTKLTILTFFGCLNLKISYR